MLLSFLLNSVNQLAIVYMDMIVILYSPLKLNVSPPFMMSLPFSCLGHCYSQNFNIDLLDTGSPMHS